VQPPQRTDAGSSFVAGQLLSWTRQQADP